MQLHNARMDAIPDLKGAVDAIVADDEKLAIKGRLTGTARGGMFDMPILEFWTIADGKITDIVVAWQDTKLLCDLYHEENWAAGGGRGHMDHSKIG